MDSSNNKKKRMKENPILMKINPEKTHKFSNITNNIEEKFLSLWENAKSIAKKHNLPITFEEFKLATEQYINQHGSFPKEIKVEDVHGVDPKIKVLVKVGNIDEVRYIPDEHSRKAPFGYYHPTKQGLYTDSSGKSFILHGKMYVANDGDKSGWLID